jgi:hypothetical protein
MLRIVVFLAAFGAAAALTAQAHASQSQGCAENRTSGGHRYAASTDALPNAYMTVNGRLFALGELLAGASRLHAARFN